MPKHQLVTSQLGHFARPTLSGAHVRLLPGDSAARLLRRFGVPSAARPQLALGAYDDEGLVIGVLASLAPASN